VRSAAAETDSPRNARCRRAHHGRLRHELGERLSSAAAQGARTASGLTWLGERRRQYSEIETIPGLFWSVFAVVIVGCMITVLVLRWWLVRRGYLVA